MVRLRSLLVNIWGAAEQLLSEVIRIFCIELNSYNPVYNDALGANAADCLLHDPGAFHLLTNLLKHVNALAATHRCQSCSPELGLPLTTVFGYGDLLTDELPAGKHEYGEKLAAIPAGQIRALTVF